MVFLPKTPYLCDKFCYVDSLMYLHLDEYFYVDGTPQSLPTLYHLNVLICYFVCIIVCDYTYIVNAKYTGVSSEVLGQPLIVMGLHLLLPPGYKRSGRTWPG